MAQQPASSDALPIFNLDITLRPLEGEEYLVLGTAEGFGETEPFAVRFPPDLFDAGEKLPQLSASDVVNLGQQLYELLFPEALTALLYQLQSQVESGSAAGLRLRLDASEARQLYDLPWEYLHNGRSFLALSDNLTIVRYLPLPASVPVIEREPQLILLVVAAGGEYAGTDPFGAVEQFLRATHELRTDSLVDVDYLLVDSGKSLGKMREMLRELASTVLHFSSHGRLAEDGLSALQIPGGQLYAAELTALLRDTAVFTVVLDSLPTEEAVAQPSFAAFAAELVGAGVPAVITLPQFLPPEKHSAFWRRYYTAFFDGAAMDTAVSLARRALTDDDGQDMAFGMPQFYTRVPHLVTAQTALPAASEQGEALDLENLTPDDNLFAANVAQQQMPITESPVQQRPLTKGSYDADDTLPGVIDAPATADEAGPFVRDYDAAFVNPVTIPEFAEMQPGQEFTKIWRVRNTGAFNWSNGELQIAHRDGQPMSRTLSFTVSQPDREANEIIAEPGRSLEISLELQTPTELGQHQGTWQLQHDGEWFGDTLPVAITVVSPPEPERASASVDYTGNLRLLDTLLRAGQLREAFDFARSRLAETEHEEALNMLIEAAASAELGPSDPTVNQIIEAFQPDRITAALYEAATSEETTADPLTTTASPEVTLPTPEPQSPTPSPRPRHIWLYQANASDENQLRLLNSDVDPLIWGANPGTKAGDLVLMYRQSPLQDFGALFTAVADAVPQEDAELPGGWQSSWHHAIPLTDRILFDHPLPRPLAHSHPDLSGWNLMRTPQGSLRHTNDLRGYADGDWPALWTLLLAWNPGQWPELAPYIERDEEMLRRDAFASLIALPSSDEKWQAVERFLKTLPVDHRLWQTAVASADLTLWQTALAARGQFPPALGDLLAKAEALTLRQQFQRVISLLTELVPQWSGNNEQQAQLHALLAQAYKAVGQTGAARDAWREASRLNLNLPQPFIRLVNLTADEELDALQAEFDQLAADYPDAAGPRAGLAAIARERREDADALEHIDAAIARASSAFRAELENLRPVTVTTAAPVPVIEEEPDTVLRRKQDRLRRFMRHHFSKKADLVDLIADLHISIDNLHGEILNHKIISLVNLANRNGRLLDLEMQVISHFRLAYNPNATDWLDRVYIYLHLGQPGQALQELDRWRAVWETDAQATAASRARGYSLQARAHEALQQPATELWLKAAALHPEDTVAYEGIVRTAPNNQLEDIHAALMHLKNSHPDAAGPKVGLAALAQRRARTADSDEDAAKAAADMADELRDLSGSLVQEARARRLADRLTADPGSAGHISLADLRPPVAKPGAGSTMTLTLQDLAVLTRRADDKLLQLDDQRRIIEDFLAATTALPTLSAGHKRELARRGDYVLREMDRRGQLTPQLVADLNLPVLDALFIDRPAARRALLYAAAAYRALSARRLVLGLRQRARKRLRAILQAWMDAAQNPQLALPDTAVVISELVRTGTVTFPAVGAFTLADLWQRAMDDGRRQATWQQAGLTLHGYLAPALSVEAERQIEALDADFWPIVADLLYPRDGRFRHLSGWERLQATPLMPALARRLLHLAAPDDHPGLADATAVSALRRLGLADLAGQLEAHTLADFCRRLRQDEDLGLQSLDDAALFLERLAADVVDFAPEPLTESTQPAIWPPLETAVKIHPHDVTTDLILPAETFRKMASSLSAGNHIILIGPPGTGKTTIAQDVCRHAHDQGYCRGFISATATADWTTFDTVGGYMPNAANQLEFSEGIILRAIREQKWLIIDEINRADIDKAFGELFTVLSGQAVTLPYRDGYHPIRILPSEAVALSPRDYVIPQTWRILGTMNEYDKASLFQMSFAFMRRFAFVDVILPADDTFADLIDVFWRGKNLPTNHPVYGRLRREIFKQGDGGLIMASRALGPAIAKDMIGYLAQRHVHTGNLTDDDLCEAFLMYALPQFDGMGEAAIARLFKLLSVYFAGTQTINGLRRRLRELFPQYAPEFAVDSDIPVLLNSWRTELGLSPPETDESEETAAFPEVNSDDI